MALLIVLIDFTVRVITLLVIVHVLLSYFMSPFHPVRETINRLLAPMLNPIRSVMPETGFLDFSPLVLLILVQLVGSLLKSLLLSL